MGLVFGRAGGGRAGDLAAWWRQTATVRLPRAAVLMGLVILLLAGLGLLLIGRSLGYRAGVEAGLSDGGPLVGQPDPRSAAGPGAAGAGPAGALPGTGQGGPGAAGRVVDPRQAGLRYYRVATYDASAASRGYALNLVRAMLVRGVDAAAIRGHNSRAVEVFALRGFGPRDALARAEYEGQLRRVMEACGAGGGPILTAPFVPGVDPLEVFTKENVP